MNRQVFLAWQDPERRSWHPIGRLQSNGRRFLFVYTHGALVAKDTGRFSPLAAFPRLDTVYQSSTLFPLFANRLMPSSRPDYPEFLRWLNLGDADPSPLAVLARSGGQRATDTLEVFPCPEKKPDGSYETRFFVHGLRHMPPESTQRAALLQSGDHLLPMWDFGNQHDPYALALRTSEANPGDLYLMGYLPRYLSREVLELLRGGSSPKVQIERINLSPAPIQFRILCRLNMRWAEDFRPFSGRDYQPLVSDSDEDLSQQVA